MHERIAGSHVDLCRARAEEAAKALAAPRRDEALPLELHRSVSAMLHREVWRLQSLNPDSKNLPPALRELVGHWKAHLASDIIETAVKERSSQWADAVLELLSRLEQDWDDICQTFAISRQSRLVAVSEPLGDLHNGGRSVYRVTFDTGSMLIYKPRGIATEAVFGKIVDWLDRQGFRPSLSHCQTLARSGYGWTGFVTGRNCATSEEAELFYRRQGAFLALFFLFCGGDCLGENFVGEGSHPIWVDTECVCCPGFPRGLQPLQVPEWMDDSVLTTLFVYHPNQMGIPPRMVTALSVSCREDRTEIFGSSDIMADRYIAAVREGFEGLYSWILDRRALWEGNDGPLSWWREVAVRVVPRATMFYFELCEAIRVAPEDSKIDARQSVREVLQKNRFGTGERPEALVEGEMRALARGDVPYWTTGTTSLDLVESGQWTARGIAERTGMERLFERSSGMSHKQMKDQSWLTDTFLRLPNRA